MKHILDNNYELKTKDGVDFTEQQRYDFFQTIAQAKSVEYKHQRANEYPPITDYLDGIVKGDEEQVQAYIDKCLEIKAKYPKG
jgi:hypothetical protein